MTSSARFSLDCHRAAVTVQPTISMVRLLACIILSLRRAMRVKVSEKTPQRL